MISEVESKNNEIKEKISTYYDKELWPVIQEKQTKYI